MTAPLPEFLKGTIERITFHNPENGFCVLRVKIAGSHTLQTVIGNAAVLQAGEYLECTGHWIHDKQHGLQFQAHMLKAIPPTTLEGMEKYLASGMVKGIGPVYAKRLVETFQARVFQVIEETPNQLCTIAGIGEKRKERIITAWEKQKKVREIMIFLHAHGVGTARATRIYKRYGETAIARLQENPYCLCQDIQGIGFKTADRLASQLGIAPNALVRLSAGITYCLQEITTLGHCGIEEATLLEAAAKTLEVAEASLREALADAEQGGRITKVLLEQTVHYFLTPLYLAEKGIASQCRALLKGTPPWATLKSAEAIEWVQKAQCLQLSSSQIEAITLSLVQKVLIITGGPGVGKTTLIHCILRIISRSGARILLTAPTGRAAKRLAEATQHEAKTIHRLLEWDPHQGQFKRTAQFPLQADLIVVDETSMVDVVLMNQLLRAIPLHACVLLIGDSDQLPSVGPGKVLSDLIESGQIPYVRLTEIFRQAASSHIVTNAHRIRQGLLPFRSPKKDQNRSDFYYIPCQEPLEIEEKLLALVTRRIPQAFGFDPIQEIQVLTPSKRGSLGTVSLNALLQKTLNPKEEHVLRFGTRYSLNDKIIQLVNNYDKEVFNGDLGTITALDLENHVLDIQFEERTVEYDFDELDEIQLAYATTIHKSQGSEYPAVVIPLCMQHFTLLERNLLYTAVTRGKKLVILLGQTKSLAIACKRHQAYQRTTHLKNFLVSTSEWERRSDLPTNL